MAVRTGLEPATSCVTGRHSNQLNYRTHFILYYRVRSLESNPYSQKLPPQTNSSQILCVFGKLFVDLFLNDRFNLFIKDDPYGIRTRVTAVKGRCLNHLTNGPYILGWRRARDSNPRDRGCGLHDFQSCSFNQLGQLSMAPQAGFEPATDRLTADCSTAELLWNICLSYVFCAYLEYLLCYDNTYIASWYVNA